MFSHAKSLSQDHESEKHHLIDYSGLNSISTPLEVTVHHLVSLSATNKHRKLFVVKPETEMCANQVRTEEKLPLRLR
jgi:hypothetical protein